MIPTKEVDYLEQDEPIRNQNFVCLSFISPEEVLKKKELYFFQEYTKMYTKKNLELVNTMETLFPDKKEEVRILKDNFDFLFDESKIQDSYNYFVQDQHETLEKTFYENNEFQTSIRGLKVRGVYDTLQEAQARSEKLRKLDNNQFSIFVAQVGCWCPWSPNPEHIENQEFAETQLNTLMKKYKENQETKKQFFEERKESMKHAIKESQEELQKSLEKEVSSIQIVESGDEVSLELTTDTSLHTTDDPWMKEKNLAEN